MATRGGKGRKTQPIAEPPSRAYGDTQRLVDAQQAMPVAQAPVPTPAPAPPAPQIPAAAPPPALFAPTSRPGEDVMAGAAMDTDDDRAFLEAVARKFPMAGIHRLLDDWR